MGTLLEVTHVALGGEQGDNAWAMPYLDDEHHAYASALLDGAEALLLGRKTYQGLSAAYQAMAARRSGEPTGFDRFVARMNALPKLVASRTLPGGTELEWNASVIDGDIADRIARWKRDSAGTLIKYGDGPLGATLARHGLIDEYHLFLTPVAVGRGTTLFADVDWAPRLRLLDVTRFASGVLALVYTPE